MKQIKLMIGDNLENLKKLEDNSVDSVVTDPPYGLGKEQDMNIVLKDWIEKGYSEIKGSGFMGKEWDAYVPQPLFWKEIYRVLKPGGHVLSFFGTRTYDIGTMAMRLAGFEIRDQIMWLYGSGFPKSHNIGKAVDKLEGNKREVVGDNPNHRKTAGLLELGFQDGKESSTITKGSSEYEGWGTALKPANEPICLARKPLSEKSVAENVLKWGTGGINIDGCRIKFNGDKPKECELVDFRGNGDQMNLGASGKERKTIEGKNYIPNDEGRFPANLILECICDEVIKGDEIKGNENYKWNNTDCSEGSNTFTKRGKYTPRTETLETHTNPMCPCRLLDEQSGVLKSGDGKSGLHKINRNGNTNGVCEMDMGKSTDAIHYGDKGGASRFFYQAKVSKKERNMGLKEGEKSTHPTVKPITLMTYLCRLITPQGGVVLDPFMGSGSTGIAARLEGFDFIGMEMDEDYVKIALARIENFEKYREFLNKK